MFTTLFMLSINELFYTLALQRVTNLGDISAKKLLRHFGSAEAIFKAKRRELLKIDGIGTWKINDLTKLNHMDAVEEELEFIKKHKIQYSYFQDPDYPEGLKHCADGPILFFHKGTIHLKNRKIISIVGARNMTSYGKAFCEELVEALSPLNPVIVSGFAYGIDITAHKAALNNNLQTVACLAHGLNQIYPKPHLKYAQQLEANGGFVSEFWSNDPFDRKNFLKRNRIIAGLSEATIVIESAEKGGSLVTADIANSYNREVFALPGRASDLQSQGCNNLVKLQQAHLLTNAADLVYMLGWNLDETGPKMQQTKLFVELTAEEKAVWKYLKETHPALLDTIALECKIPTFKLMSLLLQMELKGVVRPLPGKLFELI